jgi:hypothetical protein
LDTNVVDTNYEEVDDDYNYSDGNSGSNSHNNHWHNRGYRAGRYARGAYDWGQTYSRGISPAMENGAGAAIAKRCRLRQIATLGTVATHSNPFKPWR